MFNKELYKNYILLDIKKQYNKIKFIQKTDLIKNDKKMFLINMYFKKINDNKQLLNKGY